MNPSLPQTLQIAVLLLFTSGFIAILRGFANITGTSGAGVILGGVLAFAAAAGIVRDRKNGYRLAVFYSGWSMLWTSLSISAGFSVFDLVGLLAAAVLLALLLHPMSRACYERTTEPPMTSSRERPQNNPRNPATIIGFFLSLMVIALMILMAVPAILNLTPWSGTVENILGWHIVGLWILSVLLCRIGLTKTQTQRDRRSEAWSAHPRAWNWYHKLAIVGLCIPLVALCVLGVWIWQAALGRWGQ